MSNWSEFAADAPHLAAQCAASFAAHRHHVLATTRPDGSPRVSGTEAHVVGNDLWLGMMTGSAKLADVERDQRVAIHAAPIDITLATGDVKVAGRLVLSADPSEFLAFLAELHRPDAPAAATGADAGDGEDGDAPEPPEPTEPPDGSMFTLDLNEVVRTTVDGDELVVETWRPQRGVTVIRRH